MGRTINPAAIGKPKLTNPVAGIRISENKKKNRGNAPYLKFRRKMRRDVCRSV